MDCQIADSAVSLFIVHVAIQGYVGVVASLVKITEQRALL